MNKIILILAAALGLLLAGCAGAPSILGGSPSASALSYTPGQELSVQPGTVVAVQPVILSGPGHEPGVQITVAMDGGGDFPITQAADMPLTVAVGERVAVVGGVGMLARVFPLQAQGSQP